MNQELKANSIKNEQELKVKLDYEFFMLTHPQRSKE